MRSLLSILALLLISASGNAQIQHDTKKLSFPNNPAANHPTIKCEEKKPLEIAIANAGNITHDRDLQFQLCYEAGKGFATTPSMVNKLKGTIHLFNNSSVSTIKIHITYFWKGNIINTTRVLTLAPKSETGIPFSLTSIDNGDNDSPEFYVRADTFEKT